MMLSRVMIPSILLLCQSAMADKAWPTALLYEGKPIDPLCIEQDASSVSLKACGISHKNGWKIHSKNSILTKKGYSGYNYQMPDTGPIQAYTYYKLLAKWKNNYLIETIHSGGGSGEFTTLRTVQRRGDHLKISTLAQGDRCNGGLSKFTLKGKTFSYQINITPFDFLTLTQDNSHHLQAYKDLDACAVCCAGTLLVTRAFGSNIKSETKISVDFSHYVLNLGDQSHESNYQSCFNTLINEYKKKRKTVLTMDELKQFVQQFNQSCTVKN